MLTDAVRRFATDGRRETRALADVFGAPIIMQSPVREGSLRGAARDLGTPVLLYEGGEALRFDEVPIRAGVRGIVNVLRALDMLPPAEKKRRFQREPVVARSRLIALVALWILFRKGRFS